MSDFVLTPTAQADVLRIIAFLEGDNPSAILKVVDGLDDAMQLLADNPMIGRLINDEFGLNRDWPMASTVSVALLVLLVVPIMIYNHMASRAEARP